MKASLTFVIAAAVLACVPILAQQTDAGASQSESAKTTYAPAPAGFGDEAAARSWEMIPITGELQGKLDSKSAKAGDRVVLKTTAKVQTSGGTVIPRGSRLVGRITEVQAHDNDRAIAQLGIAFHRIESKNGGSIAVHTLIRTLRPAASVSSMSSMDSGDTMNAGGMGSRMGEGGYSGRGGGLGAGGALGGNGNSPGNAGGLGSGQMGSAAGGTMDRAGDSAAAETTIGAGTGSTPGLGGNASARNDGAVQMAGHGDAPLEGGAHAAAAARNVPHPTGIPGILLAGSSTASGLLIDADRRDIEFESGTQFELGVVEDR
jgi:hypothetical protein